MAGIVWQSKPIIALLNTKGYDFARIKTPRGWRTDAKRLLLPKDKKRLEGNCFLLAYKLASMYPEKFWYCEGYASKLPHAWVALKEFDEDWCIDLTWPYFTTRDGYMEHDYHQYSGLKFEASDVRDFLLARMKREGPNSTSMSMLKYADEVAHLVK